VKKVSCFVVLVSAGLIMSGCQLLTALKSSLNPKKTGAASLYRFKSPEELKEYLATQVRAQSGRQGTWFLEDMISLLPMAPMAFDAVGSAEGLARDGGSQGSTNDDGYSTTNLQEEGVDESDVMKNDGEHVYLLKAGELRIAKVQPPDVLEQVGQLELDGRPQSLYLRGDKLVALSQNPSWYGYAEWDDAPGAIAKSAVYKEDWENETIVSLIDATDRSAPSVIKTYRLEGYLVASRMIQDRLYLVLTVYPDLPPVQEIPETPLTDILPEYVVANGDDVPGPPAPITNWQNFYRPADPDGYAFVTVVTINTADPEADIDTVALTADAGLIYASTEALYLTDTEWGYGPGQTEQTILHKFAFGQNGAEYTASGKVPGRPLNQFSLGEHEGHLRIATTIGQFWRAEGGPTNNVFVLGVNGATLVVVGEVRNIAPGEEIYSARFVGPRGFLVTFVKIDPLFMLDLSDPNDPKVVGELKVPGYSNYIHILDPNHLLTIGKDAEDVGDFAWYQGVKLSIFDVSDFANPDEIHTLVIGGRGTESEALHDHRAFNYFAPQKALAIPLVLYEGGSGGPTYGQHTFTGLAVYHTSPEGGIKPIGRIPVVDTVGSEAGWYYYNSWMRGVFMGEHVYAVTASLIRSAALADMSTILGDLEIEE